MCNGLGFWVRTKQESSSPIIGTTSTNNQDQVDSDDEDYTDDVQIISQSSIINNSSSFIESPGPLFNTSSQSFSTNNYDDIIRSETSIDEETTIGRLM